MNTDKPSDKPSFLSVLASVIAAAIGVQKRKKLEQDFAQNSPLPYIIAGLLFTALFVGALIAVVSLVI